MNTRNALFCCLIALAPMTAQAQLSDLICDDTDRMKRQLTEVVGAEKQGLGMRAPDTMIEVWITPHSGEWTLVQTYASGTSCIVAMGDHWENLSRSPADPA